MAAERDFPRCLACGSENPGRFTAEMAIHFPGLAGLNKPIVWVFPRITICLDCGLALFKVPNRELEILRTEGIEGAADQREQDSDGGPN